MYYLAFEPQSNIHIQTPFYLQNQSIQLYYYPYQQMFPINGPQFNFQISHHIENIPTDILNLNTHLNNKQGFSEDIINQMQSKQIDGTILNFKQKKGKRSKNDDSFQDSWHQEDKSFQLNMKCSTQTKKNYKQNPNRNIITNVGNQMITFLCSMKKSKNLLKNIFPNISEFQIKQFYRSMRQLKKRIPYYLNFSKIEEVWFKVETQKQKETKKIIRILSNYYLRSISPISILNSKKMTQDSKRHHLKARKQLLNALKNH